MHVDPVDHYFYSCFGKLLEYISIKNHKFIRV